MPHKKYSPNTTTEEATPHITHPLEDKYIVFKHLECDYEDEGAVLVVYKLIRNKLEVVLHPNIDPGWCNVSHIADTDNPGKHLTPTEFVVRQMQKKGIKEVISVIRNDIFFGIPLGFQTIIEPEDKSQEVENWYEYDTVRTDTDEYNELKAAGINVRFFLTDQNKFLKP